MEVIVACYEHCDWCCVHHGQATREACNSPWHVNFRARMAVTQNYYAGATATPAPTIDNTEVDNGRVPCLACGHWMTRTGCKDRCESCGFMLDCTDGG